jgi:hypothetical protein
MTLFRAIVVVLFFSCPALGQSEGVGAPNLISSSKDDAISTLKEMNLKWEIAVEQNCGPYLSVARQQPPPHTPVDPGDVVIIWVNIDRGIPVPEVRGLTTESAEALIESSSLLPNPVIKKVVLDQPILCHLRFIDEGLDPFIVSTAPPVGTFVCPETAVTIFRHHKFTAVERDTSDGKACP